MHVGEEESALDNKENGNEMGIGTRVGEVGCSVEAGGPCPLSK